MNEISQAVEEMEKGNDSEARAFISSGLGKVIMQSNYGQLGIGEFNRRIEHLLAMSKKFARRYAITDLRKERIEEIEQLWEQYKSDYKDPKCIKGIIGEEEEK